jgi:hypothetical protein
MYMMPLLEKAKECVPNDSGFETFAAEPNSLAF